MMWYLPGVAADIARRGGLTAAAASAVRLELAYSVGRGERASQTGMFQLERLLQVTGDEARAVSGGLPDPGEAVAATRVLLAAELRLLLYLLANHRSNLHPALLNRLETLEVEVRAWLSVPAAGRSCPASGRHGDAPHSRRGRQLPASDRSAR